MREVQLQRLKLPGGSDIALPGEGQGKRGVPTVEDWCTQFALGELNALTERRL